MGPRILIVNVHWLGDVLFSTPAIRAIRKKYPTAHIACLVPKRCVAALAGNSYLNEVISYQERFKLSNLWNTLNTIFLLRQKKFDTALFFHRSKSKVFLAMSAGIPERIGYAASFRDSLLTKSVPLPNEKLHKTDYFLNLIEALGIPPDGRVADFFPSYDAEAKLETLLSPYGMKTSDSYAVIHAGGNWELKRWPAEHFVRWIRLFLREYSMRVVLCGTAADTKLLDEISAHFNTKEVVSLYGKTDLDTLALLLKKAKLLLSNDSGPIHLGASQGTPIVGLFGPTSSKETGPIFKVPSMILQKDVGCRVPCYYRACSARVCMEWLTPEEALKAAGELL